MRLNPYMARALVAGVLSFAIVSPAVAGKKQRNTVIGVGVGALAGSLLSNGDPWATAGGAVAGGVIGNVTTSDHHDRYEYDRYDRDRHYNDRRYRNDRRNRRNRDDWNDRHRW